MPAHIDVHEATYVLETLAVEEPTRPRSGSAYWAPRSQGTGTELDGINQTNNMEIYEAEDAAIQDLQNWLVNGVAAPHESSYLSATPLFFGLYLHPEREPVRDRERRGPTARCSGADRVLRAAQLLDDRTPSTLSVTGIMTELEDIFSTLQNSAFPANNSALRSSGLCMLSGYFTNLSTSTLTRLYPTLSSYVSKFTAAANADVKAGFMTQADATAAIANAACRLRPDPAASRSDPVT